MRLIDADALKEKLDELEPYIDCDENSTTWIESDEVYNAIDNAPTLGYEDGILSVETATRRAIELEDAYNNGWSDGFSEWENERPQGEWEKIGEIRLAYKCDKCGEVSVIPTNFCPNCGVKMKGGADND